MPLFFFSTEASYDADDGLEYPGAAEACRAAETALLAIAAENPPRPELIMTTWNASGSLVSRLSLVLTVLEGEHPDVGKAPHATPNPETVSERPRPGAGRLHRNRRRI